MKLFCETWKSHIFLRSHYIRHVTEHTSRLQKNSNTYFHSGVYCLQQCSLLTLEGDISEMNQKQQQKTCSRFLNDSLNVIICTSLLSSSHICQKVNSLLDQDLFLHLVLLEDAGLLLAGPHLIWDHTLFYLPVFFIFVPHLLCWTYTVLWTLSHSAAFDWSLTSKCRHLD